MTTLEFSETETQPKMREVREHAERWYRALCDWSTVEGERISTGRPTRSGGGMQVIGVGGYTLGSSVGFAGEASVADMHLRTPIGLVLVSQVTRAMNDPQRKRFDRLHAGTSMNTLLHPNGRGWKSAAARGYAVDVLGVAARLGDRKAPRLLDLLQ